MAGACLQKSSHPLSALLHSLPPPHATGHPHTGRDCSCSCDRTAPSRSEGSRVTVQHTKESSGQEQKAPVPHKAENSEPKQQPVPRHHPLACCMEAWAPAATQAPSPSRLQGTRWYLCCPPQQKSALCNHCPSPGEQGRGMQASASSFPLTNTKISSQEPRERVGVSACSGNNTWGQSSNIRAQMMTGKRGMNKKRAI